MHSLYVHYELQEFPVGIGCDYSNQRSIKNPKSYLIRFYCLYRKCVKETIIEKFAGPYNHGEYSPSVQHTLYNTQVLVLERIPEVSPCLRFMSKPGLQVLHP